VHTSPSHAARAELRAGLSRLSDDILAGAGSRDELTRAARRLWTVAQRADLDERRALLVHELLIEIAETLAKPGDLDRPALANGIGVAVEHL
jgi:hypothetical protein